jgi:tape measure domain-containing protein
MAAQDAELKLKVSLDLAFFRQQLTGLGQAAAGYKIPIQIQFDRRSVQNELNKLSENFRRRTYRLNVETNISAEIAKAETLARKLGELSGKLKAGGGFAQSPQGAAGLMEYMRSQGLSGGGGFVGVGRSARAKAALEELTVKQLQGLAKSEGITGVSRLNKSPLIDRLLNELSQTAMENILGNAQMALRRPVKGVFQPGRTIAQGPLGQYQMGASPRQGAALPTRPIFPAAATGAAGGGQRFSFTGMGSMGQFPMAGMMGPSTPLSINARTSMFGGGNVPPGGGFRNAMGFGPDPSRINLDIFQKARLPLAGAIGEVASEFANATKQVLLFGTAYKGLAFFMDLPNQAFQATKALATYKNQLQAVTSASGTFEQSFAFVDTLATRFNVPLDSARQGFVKLYASMQPAGFDQGQIEGLFTGIAKAAAAFGLSSDKVDRVNYAFAQMASKGQIMSEELKGQLGDVLPGALGLFAEAAQMSIPEFSKAMEDGAFKGKAMEQVLGNVAILLNEKFSAAATGAANTLQGAVNQIQNNLKLMYESMGPIVDQFASAFGPQVNSLLADVTSAMKALTATIYPGSDVIATMTPRAVSLFVTLRELGDSAQAAGRNISSFASSLQIFVAPLIAATRAALDFISLPFVARVGLYAAILASLNGAFQLLARTGIIQATIAMVQFAASFNIAQIGVYIAGLRTVIAVLASMITTANLARLAVMALKVSLVTLGVGAVLTALDAVAQRLLNIDNAAKSGKQSVKEFAQELDRIAASGDIESATRQYLDANTKLAQARAANQKALRDLSLARVLPADEGGGMQDVLQAEKTASNTYAQVLAARREVEQARRARALAVQQQQQRSQTTRQQLQTVDLSAQEEGAGGKKLQPYDQSRLENIEKVVEKHKQYLDGLLLEEQISRTRYDIEIANLNALKEEAFAAEQLRLNKLQIDRDNMSAADKNLRRYDLERNYEIELTNIADRRNYALKKATEDIRGPFKDAIRDANIEIEKSTTEIENLRRGYAGLTPEQQANYRIEELTKNLKADQYRIIKDEIEAARERLRVQAETNQLLEQERNLSQTRAQIGTAGQGLMAGFYGSAAQTFENALMQSNGDRGYATQMAELETQSMRLQTVFGGIQNAIGGIGDAFGTLMTEGIASMIEGTATAQEVFSGFLNAIGQALQQAAAQMIATYIAIGIARIFAGMGGGGGGLEARNASGNAAFMDRVGKLDLAGSSYANGGIAVGGFKAFANGGVVQGPTLGLVGEGKYNEAIVPLPDGRSIPVQMQGDSIRDKMGGSSNGGAMASPVLSMNFETTTINNVEYVSRDQLEQAMMETRKLAVRDGARQGANLAIDKLQQSPSTRRRIGI